jgi:hypothetical protein
MNVINWSFILLLFYQHNYVLFGHEFIVIRALFLFDHRFHTDEYPALSTKPANVFCFLSSLPLLPPQPPRQCLAPTCHLYLFTLNLTLYRRFRPACPYDWRGFVETKKEMIVGLLLVFNPLCTVLTPLKIMNLVIASPLHQLCILGGGGEYPPPRNKGDFPPYTKMKSGWTTANICLVKVNLLT